MPIYNEKRVTWNEACGILTDGSDELTPKGFVYTVIDIGNGIYVDFYNLHADAYGGAGSVAAVVSTGTVSGAAFAPQPLNADSIRVSANSTDRNFLQCFI